jgi:hypothetical protein
MTWFRAYPQIVWLSPEQHREMIRLARDFLRGEA